MASLDWSKLPNQPEFDRVVEAFFVNDNSDLGKDAYAVNGRGGDDGIDIHIRRGGRLNIVQLKFFPEGFSGGFKDRKKQILESFKSALKHDPDEWTLVIPSTLTPAERKYLVELPKRQKPPLTRPAVMVFDQPMLDQLAAKHHDLVTYFTRDELLEAAKTYNQERALLVDQSDLSSRLAALAKQGNTLDPDWGLDTFTQGDVTGTILVAKHPHAADRSPITLKLNAIFGPGDTELRETFEKFLAYGTPERIDLPASVVRELTVEGPPAFARSSENPEISLLPASSEHVGRPLTLAFYDGDLRVASCTGETTWLGGAQVCGSIHAEFYKALTVRLELPFDKKAQASMSMSLSFAGREPSGVVRAVTLLEHAHSGHAMVLELDGDELARMLPPDMEQSAFGKDLPEIFTHKDIAADLVAVQEATSLYFPYPEVIPRDDRVYLRCLRLLLEGRCIVLPGFREINQVLSRQDGSSLKHLLTSGPQPMRMDTDEFGLNVFGHDVVVGAASMYAPQIAVVDPDPILEALEEGDVSGIPLVLRAQDEYGIWVFLPDRHVVDADGRVRPVSLALPDFPDAPDVARALATRETDT